MDSADGSTVHVFAGAFRHFAEPSRLALALSNRRAEA